MKLSSIIKIHFVFFITQLKLISIENDFYHRPRSTNSLFIINKNRLLNFYKIEKIFKKQIVNNKSQYLFK